MKHLRDEDFAASLIKGKEPEIDGSLCEQCVADLDQTRTHIAGARDDVAAAAERDEVFWSRQRASIRERINPGWPGIRLEWAASLAALIAIAALLVGSSGEAPEPPIRANLPDPDYVLLAEIQQTLARPLPNAVEPVRVLASDMDQAWRAHLRQVGSTKQTSPRR